LSRPRLLDLYCCAGGAGGGYAQAGFDVTGVDIEDRPNYPFNFIRGDVLEVLPRLIESGEIEKYTLIHASPPCQFGCFMTHGTNKATGWAKEYPDLLGATRALLQSAGLPYVIEQPDGKAEIRRDLKLCGEMFGLGVIRHRHFELEGWTAEQPAHIKHRGRVRCWRHGQYHDGPYVAAYGSGGGQATIPELQAAMGITWTKVRKELNEAIPPAYTRYIGEQFLSMPRN
jgi:hypothetical protein